MTKFGTTATKRTVACFCQAGLNGGRRRAGSTCRVGPGSGCRGGDGPGGRVWSVPTLAPCAARLRTSARSVRARRRKQQAGTRAGALCGAHLGRQSPPRIPNTAPRRGLRARHRRPTPQGGARGRPRPPAPRRVRPGCCCAAYLGQEHAACLPSPLARFDRGRPCFLPFLSTPRGGGATRPSLDLGSRVFGPPPVAAFLRNRPNIDEVLRSSEGSFRDGGALGEADDGTKNSAIQKSPISRSLGQ